MGSFGICPLCPKGSRPGLLIAGKCNSHYQDSKAIVIRNAAPSKLKELAENKKTLSAFYKEEEKKIPPLCENCNKAISIPEALPKRTAIAHIVPKRTIKSVQTNEHNVWFGCWQCHTNYDNWPEEKVAKMPVIKIVRERFKLFAKDIIEKEHKYIPQFLNDILCNQKQ